jgi:Uma2 family endonuclease
MATVSTKLLTAEEFARLPPPEDGSLQELLQGVVVTMPPPQAPHGVCCSKIDRRMGTFVEANQLGTVCCNDTGFITERDPDTVRGADVAFWSKERLPHVPKGYIEVLPDLAVEVVSPDDHFSRVQKKVIHYLTRGVRLLWVVDPEDRSITVYRPDKPLRILSESDTLSGEEILPGFTCRVADLLP